MKKIFTPLLLILFVPNILLAGNEQVRGVKIIKLSTYKSVVIARFAPEFDNTQECTKTEKNKFLIRFQDATNKEMYSSLLAAAIAEKTIDVGISGCDDSFGLPTAYRIDVAF